MLGFCRPGEDSEAFTEKLANRKIERASKLCFADANVAYPRKGKRSELAAIQIEREQIPKVFDTTQMIGLDIPLLVTCGSGLFVVEPNLELFEDGVAQLLEQVNIGSGSTGAPERDR